MGCSDRCLLRRERRFAVYLACLGTVLAASCGCDSGAGGKAPDASTQATVSGSVLIDGKSIKPESSVVFSSAETGATASGKIDALGKFLLKAADPKIGIPAGRYQVMIRPPEPPPMQVGTKEYEKMMTSGRPQGDQMKKAGDSSEIAEKFQTFESSGIALEVKPGQNNFDIDLAKLAG